MSDPQIPDRTFIDDYGRRWEWCGGQPGTWAWRITDYGNRAAITAIQATSPIPDAEVATMIDELRTEQR